MPLWLGVGVCGAVLLAGKGVNCRCQVLPGALCVCVASLPAPLARPWGPGLGLFPLSFLGRFLLENTIGEEVDILFLSFARLGWALRPAASFPGSGLLSGRIPGSVCPWRWGLCWVLGSWACVYCSQRELLPVCPACSRACLGVRVVSMCLWPGAVCEAGAPHEST